MAQPQRNKLQAKLAKIQEELRVPKTQYNSFGGFWYRTSEGILEAVKPMLAGATITINDNIISVQDRVYVQSTVSLSEGNETIVATAFAREALIKKGMDESMCTGTASSYAKKTALCNLFAIDDNRDTDESDIPLDEQIKNCQTVAELKALNSGLSTEDRAKHQNLFTNRKEEIQGIK